MKNKPEKGTSRGRRSALKTIVMGAGGLTTLPILGQAEGARTANLAMGTTAGVDSQAAVDWKPSFFDAHQNETLITLTELIIPATDTPGATAAQVNRYLDLRYNEETRENQEEMIQALAWFDGRSLALHNKSFISLTTAQQTALLESVANPGNSKPEDQPGVKAFNLVKDLTIFGYYTSRIGLDEELKYQGDQYNASFPGACTHPEHQS